VNDNVTSKNVIVSCTLRAWPTLLKDEESARDNPVFCFNFAKYYPIFKKKFIRTLRKSLSLFGY